MKAVLPALVLLWPALAPAGHELDDRDLANGQVLYKQRCASCHGAQLEGQPDWRRPGKDGILPAPPHDATGHTWHHDNRLLFDYTKLGGTALMEARGIAGFRSGMPGLGDVMSDDGIWDVLAYIRSTWPERIRTIQAARNPGTGDDRSPFRPPGSPALPPIRETGVQSSGAFFRHRYTEAALSTPSKPVSKDEAVSGGPTAKRSLFMRYGMLVCCIAMMLPIAGYLLSGGTFGGLLDNLALAVPLLACVGTHFALHRLTGKSCHGGEDERDAPVRPARPGATPGATSSHWTDVIHADRPAPPAPPSPTNADVRSKLRSRCSGKGLQK